MNAKAYEELRNAQFFVGASPGMSVVSPRSTCSPACAFCCVQEFDPIHTCFRSSSYNTSVAAVGEFRDGFFATEDYRLPIVAEYRAKTAIALVDLANELQKKTETAACWTSHKLEIAVNAAQRYASSVQPFVEAKLRLQRKAE